VSDEIQPFLVYRIDADQMECALWQFKDGQKALALFLSGDAATSFKESASLGAEWKIFCPAKEALLQLLKGCHEASMRGHGICEEGTSMTWIEWYDSMAKPSWPPAPSTTSLTMATLFRSCRQSIWKAPHAL
jgi:hypothetical protein